jgi:hypothetical protein
MTLDNRPSYQRKRRRSPAERLNAEAKPDEQKLA